TLNPEIVEGLIHVLDEHNGLVRLFRTARDRRRAGEITSFKIRLYNKGGVRGYELPTSNILGGIVFEDGPNSRTDFDPGFFPELILKPRDGTGKGKKVSMNAYYKYQLHPLVIEFGLIFRGGRLFQQYVVAVFCAIEQSRLDRVCNHQNDIHSDYLLVLYTIEFQKRGLPHCHTLLWVDSSSQIRNTTQIDEYISVEIPDPMEDPRGYKVVTELMMHGPCGVANSSASCTENRVCNKHFPKRYNDNTFFNSNGHTQYQRRQTYIPFMKGESRLDNCNVVPYNRMLCLAFQAHINVEYYGWSMLNKYLFKYISKGPDRIIAKVNRSIGDASTTVGEKHIQVDEIQNYVDGHFVCPLEACWRIFEFPIHYREPAVQIRNVHLENKQRVTFCERDRLDIIVNMPKKKKTTLTKWAACEALGLLGDEKEWDIALEESTMSASSAEARTLFAQILIYYLIIWDEAPMNDKRCFKALDRTLRDLMNAPEILFGGKTVNENGTNFFAKWLLDVGNGEIGKPDQQNDEDTSWITIPQQYCISPGEQRLSKLIDFIYDDTTL
nr:DNA helicase [Tanacetum cinerariifolium]